ncbi:hypothetical protein HAZT_HAZT009040 [Hyalella azteca]|uniref:Uncharacterized protein n=1 Tax=Hyalella azteca TaxID=294128 RepID=A0A6A0GQJ5_HYAAZ|nr:hypothetical protein HAZT_HAZT009040 [Hyalella azteca]
MTCSPAAISGTFGAKVAVRRNGTSDVKIILTARLPGGRFLPHAGEARATQVQRGSHVCEVTEVALRVPVSVPGLRGCSAALTHPTLPRNAPPGSEHHSSTQRHKRSATEDASLAQRRRSIIAALDAYFGFGDSSPRAVRDLMAGEMDSEKEKHSGKKDLIHGTMEMEEKDFKDIDKGTKNMPMIVLTEDSNFEKTMDEKESKKMKAMVDHMLQDMMHSNLMNNFQQREKIPSVMSGHMSDIMHGFEHPMMRGLKDTRPPPITKSNVDVIKESSLQDASLRLGAEFATSNVASETQNSFQEIGSDGFETAEEGGVAPETEGHEPHFTTLEVALGPAILPLNPLKTASLKPFQPPEGYFVPFIPRKAFGVANGVSRPPHGHASFYLHRPAGLVDVPNSPAFGFLFSGQSRSPDTAVDEAKADAF